MVTIVRTRVSARMLGYKFTASVSEQRLVGLISLLNLINKLIKLAVNNSPTS